MIKISDACEFVNKKITRNKILIESYQLHKQRLEYEILLKKELINFYNDQQLIISNMNDIEFLQTQEYTVERQDTVNEITDNLGNNTNPKIQELKDKINDIKKLIIEKILVIKNIENLIPNEGTAINYTIKFC
jgi:hypothetical protein